MLRVLLFFLLLVLLLVLLDYNRRASTIASSQRGDVIVSLPGTWHRPFGNGRLLLYEHG